MFLTFWRPLGKRTTAKQNTGDSSVFIDLQKNNSERPVDALAVKNKYDSLTDWQLKFFLDASASK